MHKSFRLKKPLVINLYGCPGVGKSASRAGLFWLLRSHGLAAAEVFEYAKLLVIKGEGHTLQDRQYELFESQLAQQVEAFESGIQVVVTDSPLHIPAFYASKQTRYADLIPKINKAYQSFDNLDFYLRRQLTPDTYESLGRNETLEETLEVDRKMLQFLQEQGLNPEIIRLDVQTPWVLYQRISELRPEAGWPTLRVQPQIFEG